MGKSDSWPGVGDRIKQAIAKKYLKNGKPDISGFSLDKKFVITYVYKWCNADTVPDRENLIRLAKALEVSPAWLLLGDDAHKVPGRTEPRPERPHVLHTTPTAPTPASPVSVVTTGARPSRPIRRQRRDEYFYTWRCSCGFADGEPIGFHQKNLPESEKPTCPRCGLRVRYARMYRSEQERLARATPTSTEPSSSP